MLVSYGTEQVSQFCSSSCHPTDSVCSAESPFLRVKVQPSKQDRVLGDTYTYRLDFTKLRKGDHGTGTKAPQAKESAVKLGPEVRPWEEVVISLRRVEEVFGSLG